MNKLTTTIIAISFATTQVNAQTAVKFGGQLNYYVPLNAQKNGTAAFLFLNNAFSAGITATTGSKKSKISWPVSIDYVTGTNNKEGAAVYAKEKDIVYSKYAFTKSKPGGLSILAGPAFALFPKAKKMPLIWLHLQAGALVSNVQNLQYFNQAGSLVKEVKSNAVSFNYTPSLSIVAFSTKKIQGRVKVGYSSFGGFSVGVGISEVNCVGMLCPRCPGWGCNPY